MGYPNGLEEQPRYPFYPPFFFPGGGAATTTDPGPLPGAEYVPLPAVPVGVVPVFFRPTFLRQPKDTAAKLYYVDKTDPLSPDSAELTQLFARFKKEVQTEGEPINAFNVYAVVLVPLDEEGDEPVIYETFCPEANLVPDRLTSRWRMLPTLPGRPYWFEDELREAYQAEIAAPPIP